MTSSVLGIFLLICLYISEYNTEYIYISGWKSIAFCLYYVTTRAVVWSFRLYFYNEVDIHEDSIIILFPPQALIVNLIAI